MVSGDFMIQNDKTHAIGWAIHIQDAECVAATHNAADVLIEIAQLALAYRDAHEGDDAFDAWVELQRALEKVRP